MTQDEKDLLLKDLCARLPYGVKLSYRCYHIHILKGICESGLIVINDVATNDITTTDVENTKPYLFPMSSMTEEQKNDCPISETNLNIINSNIGYGIIEMPWRLSYLFTDWCNKNHFDYRGLIEMGLANDATDKNIY